MLFDNELQTASGGGVMMLRISDVEPNAGQARKNFDPEALAELSRSIEQHGLVQPIVVRPKQNGFYEIIAGERRWRASRMAGLTEVPCVIKEADDREAAELSLIENLQRENLNPIEEAEGYRALMDTFGLTQEEAAGRVGKSRANVANLLRILKLPARVRETVQDGLISYGHARALAALCDRFGEDEIYAAAQQIIGSHLSVRQTEQMVRLMLDGKPQKAEIPTVQQAYYRRLENRASAAAGRRIAIRRKPDGSGSISLAYSGTDDLEVLMKILCGNDFFENE